MHAWFSVSQNNSRLHFLRLVFFPVRFVAKVSERTNRNLPARNTLAQLWPCIYWPGKSQCTALQTDGRHDDANSRSLCSSM